MTTVGEQVQCLREIQSCLDPATGTSEQRREQFDALAARLAAHHDPACQHMAKTMKSFAPGLFSGGDAADLPVDNLDLERAFRLPKGHERRLHGHAHAGVRIVQRGPTLLLTLDAHARHPEPFGAEDLIPWCHAQAPKAQQQCMHRRRVMRMARSAKKRSRLLADLEQRYRLAT